MISDRCRASLATALLTVLCASAPVRAQQADQLYAQAKQEKMVVVSVAAARTIYEQAARAFEEQFPGVKVTIREEGSGSSELERQFEVQTIETDLVISAAMQNLLSWQRRGFLLQFKPDDFDRVSIRLRDSEGAWIAVNRDPIFYAYNPELLRQKDLPMLALDFLQPRFKAKLVSLSPGEDDPTLFGFAAVIQKYGWGYMSQYMNQAPRFVQEARIMTQDICSGASLLSLATTVSAFLDRGSECRSIALGGPTDDLLPIAFNAEAILKRAPHPYAAKLYVNWLLSKAWQGRAGLYSSRTDVSAPSGLPSLSSYRLEDRYLEFAGSEYRLTDLRKRFEIYTGAVTR